MTTTGVIIIEGHLQGLSNTRALGAMGVPVVVVDCRSCIASKSRFCNRFFRCPDFADDKLAEFLVDLAVEEGLSGWLLLPSNDHAVLTISKNRDELSKFFKFLVPPLECVERIYDKVHLIKLASELGVPVPRTWQSNELDKERLEELRYPVVTRGRFGLSFYRSLKKKAFLAETADKLEEQMKLIVCNVPANETFTQELIRYDGTNKTVSVAVFSVDGEIKTYWMGVKLREHPLQFGTATFAQSILIEECLAHAEKLIRGLRYTGTCEIEFLFDPDEREFKLIEINARTWLWVGLARACGVDFARIIFEFVNDRPVEYPRDYILNLCWVNPVTDTVYGALGVLKRELTLSEFLFTRLKRKSVNELMDMRDPFPGLYYLLKSFQFYRNR